MIVDGSTLALFAAAALALLVVPGPAVLYIVTHSIDQGRAAGLVSTLAFLPQFVDPSAGQVGLQLLVLGIVFIALGMVSDGTYALLAGTAGNWLRGHAGFLRMRRYLSGTVLIGLGVAAAVSGPRKT